MNKRQFDQYNMLQAVENHFDKNETIWNSDILISNAKADLSLTLEQISAAASAQMNLSTGATEDKAALRKDLETKAFFISTALSAYATLNPGLKELYQTVYISKTELSRFRGPDLLYFIEGLHEAAESVVGNLAPFRVTEVVLIELIVSREAFYDIMKKPATIVSNRKDATEAIADLLRQAISILDNPMDKLMELMRPEQPHFVNVYFMDRKIHHISKRSMSLEITTLNAIDKTPLADAKIEVVGKKIKRISSEKGLNRVQNLKEGSYILSISRENFVSQMIPFIIIRGETTQVVVELEEVAESQSRKVAEVVAEIQRSKVAENLSGSDL